MAVFDLLYSDVWPYLHAYMAIYSRIHALIWPYMAVFAHLSGDIWLYLHPYMTVYGHIWLHMWSYMSTYEIYHGHIRHFRTGTYCLLVKSRISRLHVEDPATWHWAICVISSWNGGVWKRVERGGVFDIGCFRAAPAQDCWNSIKICIRTIIAAICAIYIFAVVKHGGYEVKPRE